MAPERSDTTSSTETSSPGGPAGPRLYFLTLCQLASAIAVKQPQAAHLQRFTFFTSPCRQRGRDRVRLHMGYFVTLAEAEHWLGILRSRYPSAILDAAPANALWERGIGIPALQAALKVLGLPDPGPPPVAVAEPPRPAALSDAQVLGILEDPRPVDPRPEEPRPPAPAASDAGKANGGGNPFFWPGDKPSRRARACFAVQLDYSDRPIDLDKVAPMTNFPECTLYVAEGPRKGRYWYCLRLGFFKDAKSAELIADALRADFANAAVVPVGKWERQNAFEQ